jgi:hypothetical protein
LDTGAIWGGVSKIVGEKIGAKKAMDGLRRETPAGYAPWQSQYEFDFQFL